MKYSEFVAKYNNGLCDYDGAYGYQCVDLVRACADYVLGHPTGRFGGSANKGFENASGTFDSNYVKVADGSKYQEGDICFFHLNGEIGHVGIVNSDDGGSKVSVYDQNTGSGNGDGTGNNKCRIHDYPRNKLKGAWRAKSYIPTGSNPQPTIAQPTQELSPIMKRWKELENAPGFVKGFKDYSDPRPVTGGEMRAFLDVDRYNFRK